MLFCGVYEEINNPFIQLKRSESLLRQQVGELGFHVSVEGKVCFTHEEFLVYNALPALPMVVRGQFQRFFKQLYGNLAPPSAYEMDLANALVSVHQMEHPFDKQLVYSFDDLRKGLLCPRCCRYMMKRNSKRSVSCAVCHLVLTNEKALRICISELRLLFPNKAIAPILVSEWINEELSLYTIRRVLKTLSLG